MPIFLTFLKIVFLPIYLPWRLYFYALAWVVGVLENSSQNAQVIIGLRYTRARSRDFISFISATSIICIALGVATLIVVISVMNGFERELRDRILGMASHATIEAVNGGLADWQGVAKQAELNPEVEGVAPYIQGEAMLKNGGALSGTLVRGVDPASEPKVSDIGEHMVQGKLSDLTPGDYKIVLGAELAQLLDAGVGDKVDLMIPDFSVTPAGILPRFRRFTVSGIFKVGMYEYDRGTALLNIEDAAALYRKGDTVNGIRLKLHDLFQAPQVSRQIAGQLSLSGLYYVSDWTREHSNFFKAVATEKTVMFLILSLLVGIAAFNIVSTLVMVVQQKQSDIAILRTLGTTPRGIMAIFMIQGSVIGIAGTVAGLLIGIGLALNLQPIMFLLQAVTGQRFLSPDIYYISDLPSQLKWIDLTKISGLALTLGLISTLYPAWRASRVQPAQALRYE